MAYPLLKFFIGTLGRLPFWALYLFSDFLYFWGYKVLGYRKKVVLNNLRQAFPEKSEAERQEIARKFYRSLTDMIVESAKQVSTTYPVVRARFDADMRLFNEIHQSGRNIIMILGHQFNWEWGGWLLNMETPFKILGIYLPLNNRAFDQLILDVRSRYGTTLIPLSKIKDRYTRFQGQQTLTILIAEQNPGNLNRAHWSSFFGRPVPFHTGFERMARMENSPVVFLEIVKEKRGRYRAYYHVLAENPKKTAAGEITEKFARELEASVRRQPENWLWTHKRWKHSHKAPQDFFDNSAKNQ